MPRINIALWALLPLLVHGQSLHRLYTLPEWDYDSALLAFPMQFSPLQDQTYGCIFYTQHEQDRSDWLVFFTEPSGEVTESYQFQNQPGFPHPLFSTRDQNLRFRFAEIPFENGDPWRVFSYEFDNGLQRVYDFTGRLNDDEYLSIFQDPDGFRLFHYADEGYKLSRILANGDIDWTLELGSGIPSLNGLHCIVGQATDDADSLPLNLFQVNMDGQTLWSKQLTASAISKAIPDLTNFRMQTFEIFVWSDQNIGIGMEIGDNDQLSTRYVFCLLNPDGDVLWAYELPIESSIRRPSLFGVEYDSSGVTYMSNYSGLNAALHKPSNQMRIYNRIAQIPLTETAYSLEFFNQGQLAIGANKPVGDNEVASSYIYFDTNFEPIEHGLWQADDFSSALFFGPYIASLSGNQMAVLISDSPQALEDAGYVSALPNPDGGELVELTPLNLVLTDSTEMLQPGTINIELTPNPDLVADSHPAIPSKPLTTRQFSITELDQSQIMHSGKVNAAGEWEGAYYAYPWFDYTHRQSDALGNWDERTYVNRMGFQSITQDLDDFDQYFEQITAEEKQ